MAWDLSKIKGISDEVKAKLVKVKSREELEAVIEAESLTIDEIKELAGGGSCDFCLPEQGCAWDYFYCHSLPI